MINVEFALGLAMLLGIRPHLSRVIALLLFSAFLGLNLVNMLIGVDTCACFGIDIHPWLTACVDFGIVGLLWTWRPGRASGKGAIYTLAIAVSVLGPLTSLPIWVLPVSRRAVESPEVLEMGTIMQGESRRLEIRLQNTFDSAITISQVKTSCPCLESQNLPWRLAAGETTSVIAVLDLAKEPNYLGSLAITLSGGTERAPKMFQTEVRATVIPH